MVRNQLSINPEMQSRVALYEHLQIENMEHT